MAGHANYAAAIALRQDLLQRLVRVLYHAGQIPHTMKDTPAWGTVDLFLDQPKIICSAKNGNRLALDLTAWGSIAVPLPGVPEGGLSVLFSAVVLANPHLSLQDASLHFTVDGSTATLDSYQITPLSGGDLPGLVQALLTGPLGKNLMQTVLRDKLSTLSRLAPPLNVSFLGDVVNASNTTVTPRVLDGVLAIGLDIDLEIDALRIKTTGDPNLLTDVAGGYDLGMWQNPVALPVFMRKVYTRVTETLQKQGATKDDLTLTLEEGHYHLAGKAHKDEGAVTFSMNAVPHLVRPGYEVDLGPDENGEPCILEVPPREELWFDVQDVQVDVQRAWWVTFLEVICGTAGFFPFGLGIAIIEAAVQMLRDNFFAGMTSSSQQPEADRNQYFTFKGTTEPLMRLRLETYECHTEGTFMGITLRGQFPKAVLVPDGHPLGESFFEWNCFIECVFTEPPECALRPPFDIQEDDPQLKVRWTVRRCDTNEVVLVQEGQAAGRLSLSLSPIAQTLLQADAFLIECRLYRVLGAPATDFFNGSCKLHIWDQLDRSHPYVRWHHWVFTPIVRVEADKSRTVLGEKLTLRKSAIHRTAYPGRCKMVSRYSLGEPQPPRSTFGHAVPAPLKPEPGIEYLDSLPFPRDALLANRAQLCDYCFFGGPTKTTPLIP